MNITDSLVFMQQINKMHERMLKNICCEFELTLLEAKIIAFLHNNPTKDTAGDIVELRMLSKGNVSQAIDLLNKKELLSKTPDQSDRRKIHLTLLPKCHKITEAIDSFQDSFSICLFDGFTKEEIQTFTSLNKRLASNAAAVFEKGGF